MARGVIFDVDGVLVDSYRAHYASWERLVAGFGLTYSEEDFALGFGCTSREILSEHWRGRIPDLTDSRIRELDEKKELLFREIIAADFPAMDGARELIAALAADGFRIAVGSSGPPENVDLAIDRLGIGGILSARVTGADVTRGKPDPQVFLLAAERMALPRERCVVIEDARAGIRAARAAGMACIALVSTGHTRDELREADAVVASLRDVTPARVAGLIPENGPEHGAARAGFEHLPLFVFGTLRRGRSNHHYLAGRFSRMVPARLRGFGRRSPLMIERRPGDVVDGEVYFIRPDAWDRTLRACDDLEGIPPGSTRGEYARIRVTVETPEGQLTAWAYVDPGTRPGVAAWFAL